MAHSLAPRFPLPRRWLFPFLAAQAPAACHTAIFLKGEIFLVGEAFWEGDPFLRGELFFISAGEGLDPLPVSLCVREMAPFLFVLDLGACRRRGTTRET